MNRSQIILTDSGGVQEEASALAKPILILRSVTERPEVLDQGSGILVGTDPQRILETASGFLEDPRYAEKLGLNFGSPFGDGCASIRIADFIEKRMTGSVVKNVETN
jgi:UDP-N-acetylglucosamine 2-epimerase (non-hydrolysing)